MNRSQVVTTTERQQRESVLRESRALVVMLRWAALLDVAGNLGSVSESIGQDASFASTEVPHA